MGNPKDKEHSDAEATGEAGESVAIKEAQNTRNVKNACQANRDLSCERAAAIDKLVAEATTRESAQLTATFKVILNQNNAANMPTSLKVTSGAAGIKAMPPLLTGPRTRLSTRDGNYGLRRLETPLTAWRETQGRLKSHISTIGLTHQEWLILSHGRITRHS